MENFGGKHTKINRSPILECCETFNILLCVACVSLNVLVLFNLAFILFTHVFVYVTTQYDMIVSSVETVQNGTVTHQHGGMGIITKVQEQDGHKMIRVAGSGDIFAWVAKPSLADCPLPVLSGAYEKYIAGVHKGTVYALEHEGVLHLDNWQGTWSGRTHTLGEGDGKEIVLTENELCIKFNVTQSSQLSTELLSGAYTMTVNGVQQPAQVVMTVNADMSFTWTENTPSLETRIAALEAAWIEFTGPD